MKPIKLSDATRSLGAPQNWSDEEGPCETLDIHDYNGPNGPVMISAWILEDEEREALLNSSVLYLHIHGNMHPVVSLTVQKSP